MPAKAVPSYLLHKPTGQARCIVQGRTIYLGKHGSEESRKTYAKLLAELSCAPTRAVGDRTASAQQEQVTVSMLALSFLEWGEGYYRRADGAKTSEVASIIYALRPLRRLYGDRLAKDFSPLCLRAVRQVMVDEAKCCRSVINRRCNLLRRMYRWGVEQQLVDVAVYGSLMAMQPLKAGRCEARETAPVRAVSAATIEATLLHLSPTVRSMVGLQLLTGMRPGELVAMRPSDIDHGGDVWAYRVVQHKLSYRGGERIVFLGPRSQAILAPFLLRPADAFCFCPADVEHQRKRELREKRQSKVPPSQANRRRARPRRRPGERYDVTSFNRAVRRACIRAFPAPDGMAGEDLKAWYRAHCWSVNRLRHSAGTELRKLFGIEAAKVGLGHSDIRTSQIYAEADMEKARAIALQVG